MAKRNTITSTTLTSKGQATIPKQVRDLLGLKPRDRITFEVRGGDVLLRAADNPAGMLARYARVKHRRTAARSVARHLVTEDTRSRVR